LATIFSNWEADSIAVLQVISRVSEFFGIDLGHDLTLFEYPELEGWPPRWNAELSSATTFLLRDLRPIQSFFSPEKQKSSSSFFRACMASGPGHAANYSHRPLLRGQGSFKYHIAGCNESPFFRSAG